MLSLSMLGIYFLWWLAMPQLSILLKMIPFVGDKKNSTWRIQINVFTYVVFKIYFGPHV